MIKLSRSQSVALGLYRGNYIRAMNELRDYIDELSREIGKTVNYDPETDSLTEIEKPQLKEIIGGKTAEADAGVPQAVDGLPAAGQN